MYSGTCPNCCLNPSSVIMLEQNTASFIVNLAYFQVQLSSDRKHHPDALKPANRIIGYTAVSTMNLVPALPH